MAAVQAMTGGGGWPMSVFLTPDGRPFYGGTYFPDDAPPRAALVPPGPRRGRPGVPRGAARGRALRLVAGGRDRRVGPARVGRRLARRRAARAHVARGGRGRARAHVRPTPRRLGRRAEVPPADDDRVPAPPSRRRRGRPGPGDGPANARRDGRRRHPRPARRWLPSLCDRRDLARPALRADALRQRPARPGLHPRLAADRRSTLPRRRARSARVRRPAVAHGRRRLRRQPGRRHRRRRGRDVHLDGRRGPCGARTATSRTCSARRTT